MKITFFGETINMGNPVDWPVVPAVGDFVSFEYTGGLETQKVARLDWRGNAAHEIIGVDVYLTFAD